MTVVPYVVAVAVWLGLLWITSRPNASYVGTPRSRHAIAIRRFTVALIRMEREIAEALLPVMEHVARASKAFNEAVERAERAAGVRE